MKFQYRERGDKMWTYCTVGWYVYCLGHKARYEARQCLQYEDPIRGKVTG